LSDNAQTNKQCSIVWPQAWLMQFKTLRASGQFSLYLLPFLYHLFFTVPQCVNYWKANRLGPQGLDV